MNGHEFVGNRKQPQRQEHMGRANNCFGYADDGRIIGVHRGCSCSTAAKKAGGTSSEARGTSAAGTFATRRVAARSRSARGVATSTSATRSVAAYTAAAHRRTASRCHATRADH